MHKAYLQFQGYLFTLDLAGLSASRLWNVSLWERGKGRKRGQRNRERAREEGGGGREGGGEGGGERERGEEGGRTEQR